MIERGTNENFDEERFDALLESSLDELPPDSIVPDISPWHKAMNRVVLGTALNLLRLNILWLNYILPTIGMIMLILGLRRLRKENGGFMACYVLSIVYAAMIFPALVLYATRFHSHIFAMPWTTAASWMLTGVQLAYILCLSGALNAVHRKAGLPGTVLGARSLVVWVLLLLVLALMNYNGSIIGWIVIAAFFPIVYSLSKIAGELSEAGYCVRCAPVRVSDRALTLTILGVLAAAIAFCYIFLSGYPMDWQTAPTRRSEQAEVISARLAELGYPEELLADLTDEDIIACEGAVSIIVDSARNHAFYEKPRFYSRDVAVELPGNELQWRMFHHFRWLDGNRFYDTESIDIQTRWQGTSLFSPSGTFSGQVLCERNGRTCSASYYSLELGEYTVQNFFGDSTGTHLVACFSLPDRAENQRGYVSYVLDLEQQNDYIGTWMNYTHQKSWWQYPVSTAEEFFPKDHHLGFYQAFVVFQDTMKFFSQQSSEAPA